MAKRKNPKPKEKTSPLGKEHECPKCGAIHYYHYVRCGKCNKKNKVERTEYKYSNKKKPQDELEIATLAALVFSVRSCKGASLKKQLVYENLKRNKYLIEYFRVTYDPNIKIGIKKQDIITAHLEISNEPVLRILEARYIHKSGFNLTAGRLKAAFSQHQKEFKGVLYGVILGDLKIGMTKKDINKVFRKLKIEKIPKKRKKTCSY